MVAALKQTSPFAAVRRGEAPEAARKPTFTERRKAEEARRRAYKNGKPRRRGMY